ncbi:MAG: PD40 domain-containing protein [Planctomycetes bacterium]|nr:PD40 domain-containing protein [Planctomycetota bacterium]
MRTEGWSLILKAAVLAGSAAGPVAGEAGEPPTVPAGVRVDVDGDGRFTAGDLFFWSWWLESGGSAESALAGGRRARGGFDLSVYFAEAEGGTAEIEATADAAGTDTVKSWSPWDCERIGPGQNLETVVTERLLPDGAGIGAPSVPGRASQRCGRFVAFTSLASGLVDGVQPGPWWQVYRVEFLEDGSRRFDLASRDVYGVPAAADCRSPSISDDGRVVVFETSAPLDPQTDTNGVRDVYVRDYRGPAPVTRLLSCNRALAQAGDGPSVRPCVSGAGDHIAFASAARNLGPRLDYFPGVRQVFRADTSGCGAVEIVSAAPHWLEPEITVSDGDMDTGDPASGAVGRVLSRDGRLVVFQGRTSNWKGMCSRDRIQIFVRDMASGRVYAASGQTARLTGDARCPSISGDGSRIAFSSFDRQYDTAPWPLSFREDVFLVDYEPDAEGRLPSPIKVSISAGGDHGDGDSMWPVLSGDGRFLSFSSSADNLISGDTNGWTDVFVKKLETGEIRPASVDTEGNQAAGGDSGLSDLVDGGGMVLFESFATSLAGGDPVGAGDIFVRLDPWLEPFRRGDTDLSGQVNITDSIAIFNYLFQGGAAPLCLDSADADDSGLLNLTDGVYISNYLFLAGPPPPDPGPWSCGTDPTPDGLVCETSGTACP